MPGEASFTSHEGAPVNLVTALPAEARPLVRHLRLRAVATPGPWTVYGRDSLRLIVSGIGRTAAAAACGYLHALRGSPPHGAWLNVGLGGHRELEPGEVRLAHRITCAATGGTWYPMRVFASPCTGAEVCTVDRPENHYPEPVIYDMEAAAFFATAVRTTSAELVHVVKVISDNRQAPAQRFDRDTVGDLMGRALPVLDSLLATLSALAAEQAPRRGPPNELPTFTRRWHFTATRGAELEKLLRRWQFLRPDTLALEHCQTLPDARRVLACLRATLDATATRSAEA